MAIAFPLWLPALARLKLIYVSAYAAVKLLMVTSVYLKPYECVL